MKAIIFILSALFAPTVRAQTPVIPWAERQPAWVFPFYFEDATGAKDTLYWGWDPQANEDNDSIYGVRTFPVGGRFSVSWESFSPSNPEAVKVCLSYITTGHHHLYEFIENDTFLLTGPVFGTRNATPPVTMSFDVGLLETHVFPWNNSRTPQNIIYVYILDICEGAHQNPCPYFYLSKDTALVKCLPCHKGLMCGEGWGDIKSDSIVFDAITPMNDSSLYKEIVLPRSLETAYVSIHYLELRPSAPPPPAGYWADGCFVSRKRELSQRDDVRVFYENETVVVHHSSPETRFLKITNLAGITLAELRCDGTVERIPLSLPPGLYVYRIVNFFGQTLKQGHFISN